MTTNFHELYDAWQESPFTQPTWEGQLPALLIVLAGFVVLAITVAQGDKRIPAWRILGIIGSSLFIVAGALYGLNDIRTEQPATTELREFVVEETSRHSVTVLPEENDGFLWQRLHSNGEARVGTTNGERVIIKLQDDGDALTVEW